MTKITKAKRDKVLHSERRFLEGPRSRLRELKFLFKVMYEFIRGFQKLHFVGPCVTVFGSARFKEDHPYYETTVKLSAAISKLGFTIITVAAPALWKLQTAGLLRQEDNPLVVILFCHTSKKKIHMYILL
jgi:hypothetical protein